MVLGTGEYAKNPNYCTVDRIDSSLGYVDGNVVLCRSIINRAKGQMSIGDWMDICATILNLRASIEGKIRSKLHG
jgi:hypothetical protein